MHNRRSVLKKSGLMTGIAVGLSGCVGDETGGNGNGNGNGAVTGDTNGLSNQINVANYGGSMGEGFSQTVLDSFEEEHGVTVNEQTFPDNWALISQMQAGETDLDVVILDDTAVPTAVSQGLIQPLREENVPNLDNVMSRFHPAEQAFDPGDDIHSGPFQFFGDGLAYNTEVMDEPDSWDDIYMSETEDSIIYASWIDRVVGIAASHEGYDVSQLGENADEKMEDVWQRVGEMNEYVFEWADTGGTLQDSFANEQALAGMLWYGRVSALQDQGAPIGYTIPEESAPMATSGFSVTADTDRKRTAEEFINHLLEPDTLNAYSSLMGYAPTIELDELPEIVQESPDYQNRDRMNFWDADFLVENTQDWNLEFQQVVSS